MAERVRIIARKRLREFAAKHANQRTRLESWERIARAANWGGFVGLRRTFPSADRVVLPGNEITVFDLGSYRLLTYVDYRSEIVFVKEFLSHAEYDKNTWKKRLDHG